MTERTYDFHEYANIYPLLDGAEFDALVRDIKHNGLHEEIVLYEGKVLDGRNRYLACREANVEPRFAQYDGNDALEFVRSMNDHRRHLDKSQRAACAVLWEGLEDERRKAKARQGTRTDLNITQEVEESSKGEAAQKVAEAFGTNRQYVYDANRIKNEAPELFEEIHQGNLSIHKAKSQLHRRERVERINEIARGNEPLAAAERYPIIYADPPWRYEHVKTASRAIENHYPTMSLDEICALPVGEIATPDAMLFMWATNPKLAEAMRVIEAWGFTYRTNFVWVKDRIGMGYYARGQHELLLVARRGDIPVPDVPNRFSSVVTAPRGEHSSKPERFYELIEAMYPEFAKVELFARQAREGWAAWGNQAKAA